MANELNAKMHAEVSVEEVQAEYERQLGKYYEAGAVHESIPNVLAATVNAILARRHGSAGSADAAMKPMYGDEPRSEWMVK